MKNNIDWEKVMVKAPIIMAIVSYVLFIVNCILNIKFKLVFLDSFILNNISYYIICIGILIYFIIINKEKKKKELAVIILISSFALSMMSAFVCFIYDLMEYGFHTTFLLELCFGLGILIDVIYLNGIFNGKKISNKLLFVSTILILIYLLVSGKFTIYLFINILFMLSYVPYFYNLYEKEESNKKTKLYLDSHIELKIIYSIIMIASFVLLFIPAYGYDYGYGYSNYYSYFDCASYNNINLLIILVSSLIFMWTNNKKFGFYVSILYPVEMISFTIMYCNFEHDNCVNYIGIINIILSILSVWPYFVFSRAKDEKNTKKEGYKMKDENAIYEIDGNMGEILRVYEDHCVISTKAGIKSFAFGGLMRATRGDKEFYYSDITSVQFKNLKATTGYLQFEYAGSHSGNNFNSENSFIFAATAGTKKYDYLKEAMPPIYEYILGKVREYKSQKGGAVIQQVSSADEIAKFKKLLDDGIITQDEFDAKKKQLLGL